MSTGKNWGPNFWGIFPREFWEGEGEFTPYHACRVAGLVYFDIKRANVMFDLRDGCVKFVDFGQLANENVCQRLEPGRDIVGTRGNT